MRSGWSLDAAVRIVAEPALIFGSIAFGYRLTLFEIPSWIACTLAPAIPWIHYADLGLFSYSGGSLSLRHLRLAVVGCAHLHSRRRTEPEISNLAFSVALGFLSGFVDWLKYSSIFISLIVIAYLALRGWRPRKMKGGVDRCRATKPRRREIQLPVPANLPAIWDHVRA
jgi:hypothetical protein